MRIEDTPITGITDTDRQEFSVMGIENQPSPDYLFRSHISGGSTVPHIPAHKLPKGIRPEEHNGALFGPTGDRDKPKETSAYSENNKPGEAGVYGEDHGTQTH